jgi:hypothetical protein
MVGGPWRVDEGKKLWPQPTPNPSAFHLPHGNSGKAAGSEGPQMNADEAGMKKGSNWAGNERECAEMRVMAKR